MGSQLMWLCILLMIYLFVSPWFGIEAPQTRIMMNAIMLMVWLVPLMAIFIPFEWFFSLRRQTILRPGLVVDFGYYFLSGMIPTLFLGFVFGLLGSISREIIPAGYYQAVAALPVIVQVLIALAITDFGSYWGHRCMHSVPWLWQFHAIHHDPKRLDWLVNSRAHPIDIIFTRLIGFPLAVIAGFGSPGSGSGSTIPQIMIIGGILWSFFIHANVRLRLGWFEKIVSSPRFHHWHHSRDDHPNHNFAAILPIYDRIFGTHYLPKEWPPSYGIAPENEPEALMAGERGPRETKNPI